jgi:CDK-activating kinase assembly factor MAT1
MNSMTFTQLCLFQYSVYNLANDIDVAATQEKIKQYKKENQELIVINQSKQAEMLRETQMKLKALEDEKREKQKQLALQDQQEFQQRLKQRDEQIDDLVFLYSFTMIY